MPEPLRQRQPRVKDRAYLGWVAQLPCVPTLIMEGRQHLGVQVCHLKMPSIEHGKRHVGGQEKPSDIWVLPMRPYYHMDSMAGGGRMSQHQIGEPAFYDMLGINPFDLCLALRAAYETGLSGHVVIARFCAAARKANMERDRS